MAFAASEALDNLPVGSFVFLRNKDFSEETWGRHSPFYWVACIVHRASGIGHRCAPLCTVVHRCAPQLVCNALWLGKGGGERVRAWDGGGTASEGAGGARAHDVALLLESLEHMRDKTGPHHRRGSAGLWVLQPSLAPPKLWAAQWRHWAWLPLFTIAATQRPCGPHDSP